MLFQAAPVMAQVMEIDIGQTQNVLFPANMPALPNGERVACFELPTAPGDLVSVTTNSPLNLRVGRGPNCEAVPRWDAQSNGLGFWSNRIPKLDFTAGGGAYLIAGVIDAGSWTGTGGAVAITVSRRTGAATTAALPAGPPVIRPPSGTASTVTGPLPTQRAGVQIKDCDNCPAMIVIPAGSFMMGSPASEAGRNASEGPRHLVSFARAFAVGQYEVTFAEYDVCVAAGACIQVSDDGWGRGRRPVVNVSFRDASRYAAWLSSTTGQRYFLPSESEWEYAARAGTDAPWNTGSAIISDDANILNQFARTVNVGGYPPNAFGLYDVHGNAQEWTLDCYDTGYVGVPVDGAAATSGNCTAQALLRGGGYASEPATARSSARIVGPRSFRSNATGFRVTRALGE